MNIVILDGFALNPGDLEWNKLTSLGNVTIYDNTPEDLVIERCQDATIVLTNKVVLSKTVLSQLPSLQLIAVMATGYNIIDVEAAHNNGITVCNARGYSTYAVAQQSMALLLELTNRCGDYWQSVKNNEWFTKGEWSYQVQPISELYGKTLGIIGYGNIGQQVANLGIAFGMKVKVYHIHPLPAVPQGIENASFDSLIEESDVISLHCPLNNDNEGFIDRKVFTQMKNSALLINTSRGPLINEADLIWALESNEIGGAGLDVLNLEPAKDQHPLIKLSNCIITPHRAWAAKESRMRLIDILAENIAAFQLGSPINTV